MLKKIKHKYRLAVRYRKTPRRYGHLLEEVARRKPHSIVEVGVYTGRRAHEMIEAASLGGGEKTVTYFGFDLFELFTPDVLESELSKQPLSRDEVASRLGRSGAKVELFKGYSQETLPEFVAQRGPEPIDFIFIDGGHAIETIRDDWNNLAEVTGRETTVIFDDYYVDCPHLTDKFGCNQVLEELDPEVFGYEVITEPDCFPKPEGLLQVALARVWRR